MSVIELKLEFHKLIDDIEDQSYLQDLYDSLAIFIGQRKLILDDSSPETLAFLQKSLTQANKRQTISTEQLRQELSQWLSK